MIKINVNNETETFIFDKKEIESAIINLTKYQIKFHFKSGKDFDCILLANLNLRLS